MVELWIFITILCLLTVTGVALFTLRRFSRSLDNSHQEREAWQQAQESRQRTWEVRQGKHILEAEKKLADQLKDARREWRDWNFQMRQDQQEWRDSVDLEKALARLPHIEQIELAHQATGERTQPEDWRPPTFYKADLRGRDLSYRYMARVDLREAQLMDANFHMADLAGASLAGADLQQAHLLGANLSGADLRGANLSGANLMVADLHNTVLHGANLTGARNLTPEQLQTAIYDSTTLIDSAIDITLPRIPRVLTTAPTLLSATSVNPSRIDEMANTPGESAVSANAVNAETPTEDALPAPEVNIENDANTALPTEISADGLEEVPATTQEDAALPLIAKPDADNEILPEQSGKALPGELLPASEPNKKRNTGKKRTSKFRQTGAARAQILSNEREETSPDDGNANHKLATAHENERIEEAERLPRKIIQWPTRAPKTSPLLNSNEENTGERSQKNRGNNPPTSRNETPDHPANQRAQAN